MTEPFRHAPFIPNYDTHLFPINPFTCVMFQTGVFGHSSTFPVICCPCTSFFGMCLRQQEHCEKVKHWKLRVSHPNQLINSKRLKRFAEPLNGLSVRVSCLHNHEEDWTDVQKTVIDTLYRGSPLKVIAKEAGCSATMLLFTLPKVPKADSMTMVVLCLTGQQIT
ncbi:hypothetical protein ATANTOWER_014994 [Ataeniobius toweri]|uniref:Uncharacterized protein n=1 Tax=Ataeniobius toweri TaxID=208326 RepID=A0ABU7C8A0_9TELE|nr:hypothetical protein [Ataeniobius toweri]